MRKPRLWPFAVGAAVVGGIVLLARRARGAEPTGASNVTYGESKRVVLEVPAGWRRVTSAEVRAVPELTTQAVALRSREGFSSLPYGTLYPFWAGDGKLYATWVEQHYHEPGGAVKPWGLHHGVTLLARIEQ